MTLVIAELQKPLGVGEHRSEDLGLEPAEGLRRELLDNLVGRRLPASDQARFNLLRVPGIIGALQGAKGEVIDLWILDPAQVIDVSILVAAVAVRHEERLVAFEELPAFFEILERREERGVAMLLEARTQCLGMLDRVGKMPQVARFLDQSVSGIPVMRS